MPSSKPSDLTCALCQQTILASEGRCNFSAIQSYLYQQLEDGEYAANVLASAGRVKFRGLPWDVRLLPPNSPEAGKAYTVHGRCQAVIRREAAKLGIQAPRRRRRDEMTEDSASVEPPVQPRPRLSQDAGTGKSAVSEPRHSAAPAPARGPAAAPAPAPTTGRAVQHRRPPPAYASGWHSSIPGSAGARPPHAAEYTLAAQYHAPGRPGPEYPPAVPSPTRPPPGSLAMTYGTLPSHVTPQAAYTPPVYDQPACVDQALRAAARCLNDALEQANMPHFQQESGAAHITKCTQAALGSVMSALQSVSRQAQSGLHAGPVASGGKSRLAVSSALQVPSMPAASRPSLASAGFGTLPSSSAVASTASGSKPAGALPRPQSATDLLGVLGHGPNDDELGLAQHRASAGAPAAAVPVSASAASAGPPPQAYLRSAQDQHSYRVASAPGMSTVLDSAPHAVAGQSYLPAGRYAGAHLQLGSAVPVLHDAQSVGSAASDGFGHFLAGAMSEQRTPNFRGLSGLPDLDDSSGLPTLPLSSSQVAPASAPTPPLGVSAPYSAVTLGAVMVPAQPAPVRAPHSGRHSGRAADMQPVRSCQNLITMLGAAEALGDTSRAEEVPPAF